MAVQRIADVLNNDDRDRYGRFVSWFSRDAVASLTGRPAADAPLYADMCARLSAIAPAERPLFLDLVSYLPDDILAKVDRASMAVSLEVRAPLLDHRVVEFALGLPVSLKYRRGTTKWLLRQLLYKRVPRALVDRPKMGFGVPLAAWFHGPLRERMDCYCAEAVFADLGLDPDPIRRLWTDFGAGRTHRTDLLWQMFTLAAWASHA